VGRTKEGKERRGHRKKGGEGEKREEER